MFAWDSDEDRGSTPLASSLLILSYLRFNISECRNGNRNMSTEVHRQRLLPTYVLLNRLDE
jgi:hypothetical protein